MSRAKELHVPADQIPRAIDLLSYHSRPSPTGCVLWVGATDRNGYGVVGFQNRILISSRLAYATFAGPIPEGVCVLHKCDTPGCVRPDHLYLGTARDNARDRVERHHHLPRTVPKPPQEEST